MTEIAVERAAGAIRTRGNHEKASQKYIYQTVMETETEPVFADDRLLTDSTGKYLLATRRHNQVHSPWSCATWMNPGC